MKNIVIVGGSHSGFSSAWMLLHGPTLYCKNNYRDYHEMPDGQIKKMSNCPNCCLCKPSLAKS